MPSEVVSLPTFEVIGSATPLASSWQQGRMKAASIVFDTQLYPPSICMMKKKVIHVFSSMLLLLSIVQPLLLLRSMKYPLMQFKGAVGGGQRPFMK
jgi:hypothetical protein